MKKIFVIIAALLLTCPIINAFELVDTLTGTLGITSEQASGGTAALLGVAKDQLGGDDFSTVTSAVPELGSILGGDAAGSDSGTSDLLGAASSMLGDSGGVGGQVVSALGLADTFDKLGLDPAMVSQFIPIILDFAKSKGGDSVSDLLGKGFSKVEQAPAAAEDTAAPAEPETSNAPVGLSSSDQSAG